MSLKHLLSILAVLLSIFVLSGCVNQSLISKTPPGYIQDLESKTVALVFYRGRGDIKSYCTGVWVGRNAILTAKHCVDGVVEAVNSEDMFGEKQEKALGFKIHYVVDKEVEGVGLEPSAIHLSTCVAVSGEYDLALLRAEGKVIPAHQYAELADVSPAVGEKVRIMGHPQSMYWTYVEGVISSYRDTLPETSGKKGPFTQVSAPIWYGNSGGGLFDMDGKLVGIASFMAQGPRAGFFIHVNNVRKFLHDNKVL